MRRLLSEPRPDWKQKIEEQGLVFSTTTMPDGRKIEYWNESAYYEFTMDEVETLEKTAEDMHIMCLEAAKYLATGGHGRYRHRAAGVGTRRRITAGRRHGHLRSLRLHL